MHSDTLLPEPANIGSGEPLVADGKCVGNIEAKLRLSADQIETVPPAAAGEAIASLGRPTRNGKIRPLSGLIVDL